MDKLISYMKIENDDDDDYDFDDSDDYVEDDIPEKKQPAVTREDNVITPMKKPQAQKPVVAAPKAKKMGAGMEVCVIKPTSVEDGREITETLLANRTVVLNLEGLDVDIAQRIIDFASGSTFAIRGNLQKISKYIFILTPATVDISGDLQDLFGASGLGMPID